MQAGCVIYAIACLSFHDVVDMDGAVDKYTTLFIFLARQASLMMW